MEEPNSAPVQDSEAADSEDEVYLSSKYPFFDVVLTDNQVESPFQLDFPADSISELPHSTVPVDIRCSGKNWNMVYSWNGGNPTFHSGWEAFANGNSLKIGTACVFELRECSTVKMKFKVVILKSELPDELMDNSLTLGSASSNPIEIE